MSTKRVRIYLTNLFDQKKKKKTNAKKIVVVTWTVRVTGVYCKRQTNNITVNNIVVFIFFFSPLYCNTAVMYGRIVSIGNRKKKK